ncbi:MAG: prepilin-type N-terminal cleavage/methylation domain-containing protein [Verrucomicrobiota bacterium]
MNPTPFPSNPRGLFHSPDQPRGLTLMELLIVLGITAAIAGVVAVTFSGGVTVRGGDGRNFSPEEVVTLTTMRTIREALIGSSDNDLGYRQDLGELPSRMAGLIRNIDSQPSYDPTSKRGWRGPYLLHGGHRFGDYVAAGDGFPSHPTDDPSILDGWRKPIVLQQPTTDDARIVSAGADQVLETDATNPVDGDRGDDLVLFLLSADPNL